jgi:hypothetical protein
MNHYNIMSIKEMRTHMRLLIKLGLKEPSDGLLFAKNMVNMLDKERTHQTINARAFRMDMTKTFLKLIEKICPSPSHDPTFYRGDNMSTHGYVIRMERLNPEATAASARLLGVGIIKDKSLSLETISEIQDKTSEKKGTFLVDYYNGSIAFKDFVALADLAKAEFVAKSTASSTLDSDS